jgi:hypothetical protein
LRVVTIDGDLTIDQVHAQVINAVEHRLESAKSWQPQLIIRP